MKLILIRHGETCWNKERLVQGGDSDIALNETGLAQAASLARFLENECVVSVYSSPMQRAKATAEAIASRHGLAVEVDEALREINVGELEGMSVLHLNTTFSRFLMERWRNRVGTGSSDGETIDEVQRRTWGVVERLLDRHSVDHGPDAGGAVVIVSHFFVTLAIMLKALDLPVNCFPRFRVDLAGVTVLELGDHDIRLLTFNDTSY
ncbi:MAG: histidine phosphatase family protein [Dehalococcoidia bacterium]